MNFLRVRWYAAGREKREDEARLDRDETGSQWNRYRVGAKVFSD
jgi:hypothetical protein